MVGFTEVKPEDIDIARLGRRGRISYPLVKGFLEANMKCAKIDLEGLDKKPEYLRSVLTSYCKNHNIPIKLFSVQGDLHMMRLDIDNDGNPIPDWEEANSKGTEGSAGALRNMTATPLNAQEVSTRFKKEKGQVTK